MLSGGREHHYLTLLPALAISNNNQELSYSTNILIYGDHPECKIILQFWEKEQFYSYSSFHFVLSL